MSTITSEITQHHETQACAKPEKTTGDKTYSFYNKRKSVVNKITEFVSDFNQDIFIIIKDKNTNKVTQFTSDIEEFSLHDVTKLLLNQVKADKANQPI